MADVTAAQVRMMLQGYEQQLLAARRLARLRMRRRMAAGDDPNDPDPAARRHLMVEKVARELYDPCSTLAATIPWLKKFARNWAAKWGRMCNLPILLAEDCVLWGRGQKALNLCQTKHCVHRATPCGA